jgi:hypothetical protein
MEEIKKSLQESSTQHDDGITREPSTDSSSLDDNFVIDTLKKVRRICQKENIGKYKTVLSKRKQ